MKGTPLLRGPGRWLVAVALVGAVGLGVRSWLAPSVAGKDMAAPASQRARAGAERSRAIATGTREPQSVTSAARGERAPRSNERRPESQAAEAAQPEQELEPALQDAGEPTLQPHPESTPEPHPESTLEPHPEPTPERHPEPAPEPMPPGPVAPSAQREPSTRHVQLTSLAAWSQPGLCADSTEAAAARQTVTTRFQALGDDERGIFHLDPRLTPDAYPTVLQYIEEAEREISTRLRLRALRPEVFVYFDTTLMQAAACINGEVAAYYDGALHVVDNRNDTRSSTIHEYTHHALMSSGLVGPAWAQEGIAMLIADEDWWLDRGRLEHLALHPFSLDVMEQTIPYRLPPEQAVAFYVQAAATVACILSERGSTLRALVDALRAGTDPARDALSYERPRLDSAAAWRKCTERLLHEPDRWKGR